MNALILVDIQNDFLPGGALAVSEGDLIVPVANKLIPLFDFVIATQDWHPADHHSFASQHEEKEVGDIIQLNETDQILWPDHCVQETPGAALHNELALHRIDQTVLKGTDQQIDSYSGFFDNDNQQSTGLAEYLKEQGVTDVAVMGLATDYCVKFTALDAVGLGLETTLIKDGSRGVDLQPGDIERAVSEMSNAGVKIVDSDQIILNQKQQK